MRIQEIDLTVNLLEAILWQYNEATHLIDLLQSKQLWYEANQSAFWGDWFDNVFNLVTADQFGLIIWSIILNTPIYANVDPEPDGTPIYGFNQDVPVNDYVNFNNFAPDFLGSNFSNLGSIIVLPLEVQRLILRLRYYQLVSRGAIPETNTFLNVLFNSVLPPYQGDVWVLDGFDMTMTYVFNFYVPKVLRTVLKQLDLLPRPAAVGLKYVVQTDTYFGFGTGYQNFENGDFAPSYF